MFRHLKSKHIATVLIAALLIVSTAGTVSADDVDLLSGNAGDSILIDTDDANNSDDPDNNAAHSDKYSDDNSADPDEEYADHVDNVVLISFDRQLNREEISNKLRDTGIESVKPDSVLFISDGIAKITVRKGHTVSEAIEELSECDAITAAQPDYVYTFEPVDVEGPYDADDTEARDKVSEAKEIPDKTAYDAGIQDKSDEAGETQDRSADDTEADNGTADVLEVPGKTDTPDDSEADVLEDHGKTDTPDTVTGDVLEDTEETDAEQGDILLFSTPEDRLVTENEGEETGDEAKADAVVAPVNDPYYPMQWGLRSINAPEAWQLSKDASSVGVAIFDAGFDVEHKDLKNKIIPGSAYNAYRAAEDEGDITDVTAGPAVYDHGTHIAGIIAAEADNGIGIAGIAGNAGIIPIRVFNYTASKDHASATTTALIKAFDYVKNNREKYNIRLINMSLGAAVNRLPQDDFLLNSIDEAFNMGIVTVCSAGNEAITYGGPYINYPSAYMTVVSTINLMNNGLKVVREDDRIKEIDCPDVYDVSRYRSSNWNKSGNMNVDISAPGTNILSTDDGNSYVKPDISDDSGKYLLMTGTSMAAPQVAGVLALMFGKKEVTRDAKGAQYMIDTLYSAARGINESAPDTGDGEANEPDLAAEGQGDAVSDFTDTEGYGELNAATSIKALEDGLWIEGPMFLKIGTDRTYSVCRYDAGVSAPETGWELSSSDPAVLTVDAEGKAHAAETGQVVLKAVKAGRRICKTVTVLGEIMGIGGENGVYEASLISTDRTVEYTVSNPQTILCKWSVEGPDIAKINAGDGKLTPGPGIGRIKLKAEGRTPGSEDCRFEKDVWIIGSVEGPDSILRNEVAAYRVSIPEDFDSSGYTLNWYVDDPSVAVVDENGNVTGISEGACTIGLGTDRDNIVTSKVIEVSAEDIRDKFKVDPIGDVTYAGKSGAPYEPLPVVRYGERVLEKDVDYSTSYENNKDAGAAVVKITGKGTFARCYTETGFTIVPFDVSSNRPGSETAYPHVQMYVPRVVLHTGEPVTPSVDAMLCVSENESEAMVKDRDYTIEYSDNTDVGIARATLTGKGNYKGTLEAGYEIKDPVIDIDDEKKDEYYDLRKDLKGAEEEIVAEVATDSMNDIWIGGLAASYTYTGNRIRPVIHVYDGIRELTEGTDYSVKYSTNKNVGEATISVKFKGNYINNGAKTTHFDIVPAELGSDVLAQGLSTEAGSTEQKPVPQLIISASGRTVNSKCYTVEYDRPVIEAGTYTAVISAVDANFIGETTAEVTLTDKDKSISDAKVVFDPKVYSYTGKETVPAPGTYKLSVNNRELAEGVDYRAAGVYNNLIPGMATMVFEAIPGNENGYTGSVSAQFRIKGNREINTAGDFTFIYDEEAPYRKGGVKPSLVIMDGDTVLKQGTDYRLTYRNYRNLTDGEKTASITVRGKGRYRGVVTLQYGIVKRNIAELEATVNDVFVGKSDLGKPSFTIQDISGRILKNNKDYTVQTDYVIEGDEFNGTVTFTVNGAGNYTGETKLKYRYSSEKKRLNRVSAAAIEDRSYTGKAVELSDRELSELLYTGTGDDIEYLKEGTDFTVVKYKNNVKKGKAKLVLRGMGRYSGTKTLKFRISKKPVSYRGALINGTWR